MIVATLGLIACGQAEDNGPAFDIAGGHRHTERDAPHAVDCASTIRPTREAP
ncbi:MAG: hypothetical protein O2992_03025 [Gemmatimonadetes bacterium]|nr:hypothetical protein [Gemmatimonadota bacterium]